MKGSVLCVLLCVMVVSSSNADGGISQDPDAEFAHYRSDVAPKLARIRKLKEIFNLEDYRPYDPSPSSKASIRHGPIQHGTPLMPYIPRPSSPPPSHGGIP